MAQKKENQKQTAQRLGRLETRSIRGGASLKLVKVGDAERMSLGKKIVYDHLPIR